MHAALKQAMSSTASDTRRLTVKVVQRGQQPRVSIGAVGQLAAGQVIIQERAIGTALHAHAERQEERQHTPHMHLMR